MSTFSGLSDTNGPSFGRRVVILETLARYRSCVVMLDLECDDLINDMVNTFFAVARYGHFDWALFHQKQVISCCPFQLILSLPYLSDILYGHAWLSCSPFCFLPGGEGEWWRMIFPCN